MPFTPSHAVVALPFLRTPLVPGAIAVGAMTPDLPLFVRGVVPPYAYTHDLAWLPVTVLIAGILLILWRALLRPAAAELSPGWLSSRLPRSWDSSAAAGIRETFAKRSTPGVPSVAGAAVLIASLAVGVFSHILWDQFTHEGRWGSAVFPILDDEWGPFPGYRWLQHGSSALGLAVIGAWAIVWLRAREGRPVVRLLPRAIRIAWWVSLPAALVCAWVWGVLAYGPFTSSWTPAHLGYRMLPPACAIWGAATSVLALVIGIRRAKTRPTPGARSDKEL